MIEEIQNVNCGELLKRQLDIYAKRVSNNRMSPSTYEGYRKIINGSLMPIFGKYNIADITPYIIKQWVTSLTVTPKTAMNCITPLKHVFDDALNDGIIAENPLNKLALKKLIDETLKPSDYYAEPFNETEKQIIINAISGQLKNLIQFGLWSRLRTSELIALKWADIDLEKKVANIRNAKVCKIEKSTKTKAGIRTLILLPKALSALIDQHNYTGDSEYVFHNPNTNKAWSSSGKVSDTWRKILSKLDIKYRNCYQMRHTYASTLLSKGENPLWVSTQMGHVDIEMISKKYGRWIPNKDGGNGYNFVGDYE